MKIVRIAGVVGLALLLFGSPGPVAGGDDKVGEVAGLDASRKAQHLESFEVVWKTVRDQHFDPKLGGVNWQAVHDELRPKVERAKTDDEARDAMSAALERLGQTHFAIIPSTVYKVLENPNEGPGEVGIETRLIDGRIVVIAVDEGLPAAAAGVKPGWIIEKAGGKPVAEILKAAESAYSHSPRLMTAYKVRAVDSRLHGRVGSVVAVDLLDGKDKPVHLELKAREPVGVRAEFGHLPPLYVRFASRRIGGSVVYVSLNIFFDPVNVLKQFGDVVESSRRTPTG